MASNNTTLYNSIALLVRIARQPGQTLVATDTAAADAHVMRCRSAWPNARITVEAVTTISTKAHHGMAFGHRWYTDAMRDAKVERVG